MKTKKLFGFHPIMLAPILVGIALFAPGCDEVDLGRLSQTLAGIATANDTMLEVVLAAEDSELISDAEARPFVEAALKIGLAGREAVAVTAQIAEMDAAARGDLFQILDPILDAVDAIIVSEDLSGLKNAEARASIRLTLVAIRTTITTARVLMED